MSSDLDCVVIGYNEQPIGSYEALIARYGRDSVAYRDLRFSFVDVDGEKLDYCGLLNRAAARPGPGVGRAPADEFKSGDIPNLAAAYLTNYLRKHYSVVYINLFQHEKQELADLLARGPRCVAITTTFYVLNFPVTEMVRFIRAHNAETKIVVGGPLVGNYVRRMPGLLLPAALEEIGADIYVVDGQGEATLDRIVGALSSGGDLDQIPNLLYWDGTEWRRTATVPEQNSMDDNIINWTELADHQLGSTLQTRTARSCAFNCSFCGYPERAGKLSLTSVDAVEKELSTMRDLGFVRNVVFIDDTFNVPLPRFKQLCRRLIDCDFDFSWYSYFRCSNSDDEAIELAARSGCKGVFLGVESGSDVILKNMNKRATIEKYERGVELLKRYDILTFGSFISGFPGETAETFAQTVDFIQRTELDYYRIQPWYCEPGTPIFARREELGIKGEGFRWSHPTMNSSESIDRIEQAFLEIGESQWLPQWSFDFWIIPYLAGRGLTPERFRRFMQSANEMLALEIGSVGSQAKADRQAELLDDMGSALAGIGESTDVRGV
ncbi:MAG: PhpK family radical SAM P-methyltransferase [Pseudonocardiaceae bacterium]